MLKSDVKLQLTNFVWRGPYEVVEKVGEVDYKIRVTPDKIKTYHINMLKKYHQRKEQRIENDDESGNIRESEAVSYTHLTLPTNREV